MSGSVEIQKSRYQRVSKFSKSPPFKANDLTVGPYPNINAKASAAFSALQEIARSFEYSPSREMLEVKKQLKND